MSTPASASTSATPSDVPVVKSASPTPPFTFADFLNMVIYTAFTAAAVYYGWTYGRQYALQYWMVVQALGESLGKTIREFIQSMRTKSPSVQTARARY